MKTTSFHWFQVRQEFGLTLFFEAKLTTDQTKQIPTQQIININTQHASSITSWDHFILTQKIINK